MNELKLRDLRVADVPADPTDGELLAEHRAILTMRARRLAFERFQHGPLLELMETGDADAIAHANDMVRELLETIRKSAEKALSHFDAKPMGANAYLEVIRIRHQADHAGDLIKVLGREAATHGDAS